jgi:hypothetical protein
MRVVPKPEHRPASGRTFCPRGNLRATPFAELLVSMLDQRCTGTLRLLDARGETHARVCFDGGIPIAARTASAGSTLAQSLIPLCACSEGEYVFVEARDEVGIDEGAVAGRVDPVALINAAMRGPLREDRVQRLVDAIGEREVRLHQRTNLARYQLTAPEREVVDWLAEGVTTLPSLLARPGASERLVRRMFYVLRITRALSLVPASRNVSGTIDRVRPPSAAPPAVHTVHTVHTPDTSDTSDTPGRYHVRYAQDAPVDVVPRASKRPMPFTAQARHEREAEAVAQRRTAERLLRASDYPGALAAAHAAMRGHGCAAHEALYAWILFLQAGSDQVRVSARALRHFDNAVTREPDSIEAHYYLALFHKRSGDDAAAYRHIKRVLRLEPDHADAARELRVWQMRRRSQTSTSLISKLLRKHDER